MRRPDVAFQVFLAVLAALLIAWFVTRLVDHYVDQHCFDGGVIKLLQDGEVTAVCAAAEPAVPPPLGD